MPSSGPSSRAELGVYLVQDGGKRLAMVLRPVSRGPNAEVVLQIAGENQHQLDADLREVRGSAASGACSAVR